MLYNGNYNQVLCLCRSLYRLKQLARLWFDLFAKEMLALRFFQSQYDNALFFNGKKRHITIYMDDFR